MYMSYRGTEFLQSPLSLSASGLLFETTGTASLGSESGLKSLLRFCFCFPSHTYASTAGLGRSCGGLIHG